MNGDVVAGEPMDVSEEDESHETRGDRRDAIAESDNVPSAKFRVVENVKNNVTEFSDTDLTVHMYVKEIRKDSLKVDFKDNSFSVMFQTS